MDIFNKKPDLKKATHECTCKTGRLTRLLCFDSISKFKDDASQSSCTYKCKNCGAIWQAKTYIRNNGWSKVQWRILKQGPRA